MVVKIVRFGETYFGEATMGLSKTNMGWTVWAADGSLISRVGKGTSLDG